MRIGTWNVDRERARATSAERRAILNALNLDVAVITEPGPWWDRPAVFSCAERPPMRPGLPPESWVAIEGPGIQALELEAGYGRMGAAALAVVSGLTIVVYGSVLPWNGIKEAGLLLPGESYRDAFPRLLSEQAADVDRLATNHPGREVIWAGDFNQGLAPPHHVGSASHRDLLQDTLARLGLVAWNGSEPAAHERMKTIDLICGSARCAVKSIERVPHTVNGRKLSDHAGWVVELHPLRRESNVSERDRAGAS